MKKIKVLATITPNPAPSPIHQNGQVAKSMPPRRRKNVELRTREHLTPAEVEAMRDAATGLYAHRDSTLVLLGFTHGLRVSELVDLRWDDVELKAKSLLVRRLKGSKPATHPLRDVELQALRKLKKDWPDSKYLFNTERGGKMASATARKIIARLGVQAGIEFPVHPHMLRHACGFYLASLYKDTPPDVRSIQSYLGHKFIGNTSRYTDGAPGQFADFFND